MKGRHSCRGPRVNPFTIQSTCGCHTANLTVISFTVLLLLRGKTVDPSHMTGAVFVDRKPWSPLMFRQLRDSGTRYLMCDVSSFELSDRLCC
jgi:hypothetical protein